MKSSKITSGYMKKDVSKEELQLIKERFASNSVLSKNLLIP
jgi:hypothetical protein